LPDGFAFDTFADRNEPEGAAMTRLAWLAILALLVAALPAAAQDDDLHFTENSGKGSCYARVWGGLAPGSNQRMVIELGYGADDGNLSVLIRVSEWQRARDADPNRTFPMTLILDSTLSTPSHDGGYDSPYDDLAWGSWEPVPSSTIMARLKTARSARVLFDGMDLGPFRLPAAGKMYRSLTDCAARLRAGKP
jgi:hypothetical protein